MAVSQPHSRGTRVIAQDIMLTYGAFGSAGPPTANSSACTERLASRQDKRYLGSLAVLAESVGDAPGSTDPSRDTVGLLVRNYFSSPQEDPLANLQQAISTANGASYAASVQAERPGKVGAKVAAVAIIGQQVNIVSIGDIRAYLVRDGQATPITRATVQVGSARSETLFLGQGAGLPMPLTGAEDGRFSFRVILAPGDALVLCNNNLAQALRSTEIARLAVGAPAALAAEQLVKRARQSSLKGTAVVIHYGVPRAIAPRWRLWGLVAIPLLMLLIGFVMSRSWSGSGSGNGQSTAIPIPQAGALLVPIGNTEAATATPSPVTTNVPTSILAPINTRAPTNTSTPTPSPTLVATTALPSPPPTATPSGATAETPNTSLTGTPSDTTTEPPTITPSSPTAEPPTVMPSSPTTEPPTAMPPSPTAEPPTNTPTPTPTPVPVQLTVQPNNDPFIEPFIVNGRDFAANERISLWLKMPKQPDVSLSDNASANANGVLSNYQFSIADIVPDILQEESWTIIARGHTSLREGRASFTVQKPPLARLAVWPGSGTFTDPFIVSGSGFVANEEVSLWLTTPDGLTSKSLSDGKAVAANGVLSDLRFNIKEHFSDSLQPGTWSVAARGHTSRRQGSAEFVVEP